ncbi:MAG: SoxR reducing system RseC family protein [Proteobacteria bacterium]|nr:SoxR reducing system RseC family protein [Pseudomonadota bacterium]
MEEVGVIVEVSGSVATIKASKSGSCDSCSAKKSCASISETEMLLEAENCIGAKVGDQVMYSVDAGSIIKAGVMLYLMPIIAFIAGVVIGTYAAPHFWPGANPDLVTGLFGILFLTLAFTGLKLYSRITAANGAYKPQILRVV